MHLRTFFCIVMCCSLPLFAYGGTLREVELIDGSIIRAEVLSMDGKIYRLRSDTMGTMEVPESQVKALRTPGASHLQTPTAAAPTASPTAPPAAMPGPTPSADELQQALSRNPEAMNKILSLQNDPLMQQILGDADTMKAVQSGNLDALMNDPRIRALMNHPTIRELSKQ